MTFFMAINAYMADVTAEKHRTKRVAFMCGLWPIGFNVGKALSGVIQSRLGFMYNFSLGLLLSMVAMCYMTIFVRDSIKIRDKRLERERIERGEEPIETIKLDESDAARWKRKIRSLFDIRNMKEGFVAVFKKRDNNMRTYLILMIFCFEMEQFINVGEWGSSYLYLRRVLGFTMSDFSRYLTVIGVIGIIAQYITVPIMSEKLKLHDATITLIDITGCFFQTLIVAFVQAEWMLYLAACVGFLDYTSYSMLRCMISKYVEPDELGKILSVVGALQAFIPIVSSPIFGILYRNTVDILPQTFLLVLDGFFFINWCTLVVINIGVRKVDKARAEAAASEHRDKKEQEALEALIAEQTYEHGIEATTKS